MRTQRRSPTPLASPAELLAALRGARLAPPNQVQAFADLWADFRASPDAALAPGDEARLRARELTEAGVLTAWQAEQVLAGHARQLRLGPYTLLDWLGSGGMGSVYKARHRLMNRVVALKVVGPAPRGRGRRKEVFHLPGGAPTARRRRGSSEVSLVHEADPALSVARFRREVEAAARLSHPNIVAAHHAARARGVLYLVLEYVEGVDFGRLVAEAGPLPVRLACEAVRQAALALQYAHDRGLLHCDVKPSNLILVHPARDGWDSDAFIDLPSNPLVKLLDLGLARLDRDGGADGADDLDGTPDYMAPERGAGDPLDARSDLYSLGCAFYHLLTGQVPFPGGSWSNKLLRHRLDAAVPVRNLRPDAPAEVAAVVERLMARDVELRYPSAAVAVAELEAWLDGPAPAPPAPASVPRAANCPCPSPTRRTPLPPLSGVVAAALTGFLVAFLARWALAERAAAPPPSVPALAVKPAPAAPSPATPPAADVPPAAVLPFLVEGKAGGFATLAEAVAAAADGAVVTVRGAGPYPTPPLAWHGKALTLRAAAGCRPCLETTLSASDPPWQALLSTDRDLTLQGLDLHLNPGGARTADAPVGRLVSVEGSALRITDCRLVAPRGTAVVHRNGGELLLQSCRVEAGPTALSVQVGEAPSCRVRLADCVLTTGSTPGTILALWALESRKSTAVAVELEGDALTAGRVASLTALPAGVRFTAHGNRFTFRDGVLRCSGYSEREGWRRATTWEGRDNRYCGPGGWLSLDGESVPVRGLAAWRTLWGDGEPGSREESPAAAATGGEPGA